MCDPNTSACSGVIRCAVLSLLNCAFLFAFAVLEYGTPAEGRLRPTGRASPVDHCFSILILTFFLRAKALSLSALGHFAALELG